MPDAWILALPCTHTRTVTKENSIHAHMIMRLWKTLVLYLLEFLKNPLTSEESAELSEIEIVDSDPGEWIEGTVSQ